MSFCGSAFVLFLPIISSATGALWCYECNSTLHENCIYMEGPQYLKQCNYQFTACGVVDNGHSDDISMFWTARSCWNGCPAFGTGRLRCCSCEYDACNGNEDCTSNALGSTLMKGLSLGLVVIILELMA